MDQKIVEQIDDYLMGRLSNDERQQVEVQLAANADLQKVVQQRQLLMHSIDLLGEQQFRARLKEIHREETGKSKGTGFRQLPYWLAAAVVASIALLAWIFLQPSSNDRLYHDFYQAYKYNSGERGSTGSSSKDNRKLVLLYQQKKYAAAAELLATANRELTAEEKLIWGICKLEGEDFSGATSTFMEVIGMDDIIAAEYARWYLALSLLKTNQIKESINTLQPLANKPEADSHKKAKMLLKALEKK